MARSRPAKPLLPAGLKPLPKFRSNPLFREDFDSNLNAAVGDNGGPYDFGAYAQGFFEGGFAVIAAARSGKGTVDLLIYPAVFSFRDGIELYIKHFLAERFIEQRWILVEEATPSL